jgi:ribosomal protein S6--L-glutamate ligase
VLEVNSTPGLEGIEFATRKDVAGMIIDFLQKDAAKRMEGAEGRT